MDRTGSLYIRGRVFGTEIGKVDEDGGDRHEAERTDGARDSRTFRLRHKKVQEKRDVNCFFLIDRALLLFRMGQKSRFERETASSASSLQVSGLGTLFLFSFATGALLSGTGQRSWRRSR